jgi:hypothetical protein
MPYNLLVIFTGDVLGATQIFKKIKTDLKENRTLSIAEPPWPPLSKPVEWKGHNPKTSRLVHGAGIMAMGFVMETIAARHGASTAHEFADGLKPLKGRTAWTSGHWQFSETERVPWNAVENTPRQIMALAQHLIAIVRRPSGVKMEDSGYKAAKIAVAH